MINIGFRRQEQEQENDEKKRRNSITSTDADGEVSSHLIAPNLIVDNNTSNNHVVNSDPRLQSSNVNK
jgi:hypothetical protein